MLKRIVVLDTSVLIHDPAVLFKEEKGTTIVIPATVIAELNHLKEDVDRLRGLTAQQVLTYLDDMSEENSLPLSDGFILENGNQIVVELNHITFEKMNGSFDEKTNDNKIIAVAKNYTEEYRDTDTTVELLSNDKGMRVIARILGVNAKKYNGDNLVLNLDEVYKGYSEVYVSKELIDKFYKEGSLDLAHFELDREPYLNEFIILVDDFNVKTRVVGRVRFEMGRYVLTKLFVNDSTRMYGISPLDEYQKICFELLLDDNVPFVSIIGKAGSGKTLLALAAALGKVENENKYKRVLGLSAQVEVGNKKLGYIPGDKEEKLLPYVQPYYDNLEILLDCQGNSKKFESIMGEFEEILEMESTGFMRGRTLPRLFIIVDEAQNLTKHEIKTLITRAGEGAKIVLLGDPTQIDDPFLDSVNNGLIYATEKMKEYGITGTVYLAGKSKRSELAELAANVL